MASWRLGSVVDLLLLAVLLGLAAFVRTRLLALRRPRGVTQAEGSRRRLEVPDALVAGILGFALGPSGAGLLPFDQSGLELVVYHLFAIIFITQSLRVPARPSGDARVVALAIPTAGVLQLLVGLAVVGLFVGGSDPVHPGFGLLMMLGFLQGPGQALALGSAWEAQGLPQGGELGLSFGALGFVVCVLVGVPLVPLARKLGWDDTTVEVERAASPPTTHAESTTRGPGSADALAAQLLTIGCVYATTWALLEGTTRLLPAEHPVAAALWGFHFIVAALIGLAARRVSPRLRIPLDDDVQNRISSVAIDLTTAAALAAVQVSLLSRWLTPMLLAAIIGALVSLWFCLWIARRAISTERFGHALALFGFATGTLPTGLSLLRMVDPRQRGDATRNTVLGAAASILPTAPLMLGFLPLAVSLWPLGVTAALEISSALLLAYLAMLAFGWGKLSPPRLTAPHWHPWPPDRPASSHRRGRPDHQR